MDKLPKISIITPSYNQGQYLEETILSVLNQNYPNLEYIVIDGGSHDNSVEIIKQYSNQLTYWVSEKDQGQSHAINKGFAKATGDIIGWINSDDLLMPDTLDSVAKLFEENKCQWLTGNCQTINSQSKITGQYIHEIPKSTYHWLNHFVRGVSYPILQPSTFWTKALLEKSGQLNEMLHYSFDHEFFFRLMVNGGIPLSIDRILSMFRLHDESKTVSTSSAFTKENQAIALMHLNSISTNKRIKLYSILLTTRLKNTLK